jgi:hypothetical protein
MRPLPAAIHRAVLIALALTAVAPSARAFELQRHSVMTIQVLGRQGVSGPALALIAFGAMMPDVQDCIPSCYCDFAPSFCQPNNQQLPLYGANHFDNNLFDESIARVNQRMAEAQSGVSTATGDARASAKALVAFGRALHTTQDFYAHSTFVEINLFPGPVITTNINNLPLWQGQPYALYQWHNNNISGFGDLQTGYYIAAPPLSGFTHDQLNKDSPGSPEGSQSARVSGVAPTNLYGVASGDLTGSYTFTDLGLAPRHTIQALGALLNNGLVFPYIPIGAARAVPADPAHAQRVLDFFAWVNQDPTLIAMAQAADSLMAHANADSIGAFPIGAIDADGLPLPLPTAVTPAVDPAGRLLGAAHPNPFSRGMHVDFTAPRAGTARVAVYDLEGRTVATLFAGEVSPGVHAASWDGRGPDGNAVPAGVYLVRLAGFGRDETRRVTLAR